MPLRRRTKISRARSGEVWKIWSSCPDITGFLPAIKNVGGTRTIPLIRQVTKMRKPTPRKPFDTPAVRLLRRRLEPPPHPLLPTTFRTGISLMAKSWEPGFSIGAVSKTKKPPLSSRFQPSFSKFPPTAPERRKALWGFSPRLPGFRLRRKDGISRVRIFPRPTSRRHTVSFRPRTTNALWPSKAILRL